MATITTVALPRWRPCINRNMTNEGTEPSARAPALKPVGVAAVAAATYRDPIVRTHERTNERAPRAPCVPAYMPACVPLRHSVRVRWAWGATPAALLLPRRGRARERRPRRRSVARVCARAVSWQMDFQIAPKAGAAGARPHLPVRVRRARERVRATLNGRTHARTRARAHRWAQGLNA